MGAEIDQMDLAERWIAARCLLAQFETGTQIGKLFQIGAPEFVGWLIAIIPGREYWARKLASFRNQRRVDIETRGQRSEKSCSLLSS